MADIPFSRRAWAFVPYACASQKFHPCVNSSQFISFSRVFLIGPVLALRARCLLSTQRSELRKGIGVDAETAQTPTQRRALKVELDDHQKVPHRHAARE